MLLTLFIIASALFTLWLIWDTKKRNKEKLDQIKFERVVKQNEARANLERILSIPRRQPELWWGTECITLSQDGKKVVHKSSVPASSVRAGGGRSSEDRYPPGYFMRFKAFEKYVDMLGYDLETVRNSINTWSEAAEWINYHSTVTPFTLSGGSGGNGGSDINPMKAVQTAKPLTQYRYW